MSLPAHVVPEVCTSVLSLSKTIIVLKCVLKVKVEDKLHGDLVYCFGGRCGWMERTEQNCRQLPGRQSTACKEASGPHLGQVGAMYALVPMVLHY